MRAGTLAGMDYLSRGRVEPGLLPPLAEIIFTSFDA